MLRLLLLLFGVCESYHQVYAPTSSFSSSSPSSLPPRRVLNDESFGRLVRAAQHTGRPLRLSGRAVELSEAVVLSSSEALTVVGPGTVAGDGHAIFTVGGNRQALTLSGPDLHILHRASPARQLRRETGAALFCRGKARVRLQNGCCVRSEAGYGVWMVQKASVSVLGGSKVHDSGRSGIACFGSGRLVVSGNNRDDDDDHSDDAAVWSCVTGSGIHGICARGSSQVVLGPRAAVAGSGLRGVYAYHNASLALVLPGVSVTGTRETHASAVQVEALRPCDRASFAIVREEQQQHEHHQETTATNTATDDDDNDDHHHHNHRVPSPLDHVLDHVLDLDLVTGNRGFSVSVSGNVDCAAQQDTGIDLDGLIETRLSAAEQLSAAAAGAAPNTDPHTHDENDDDDDDDRGRRNDSSSSPDGPSSATGPATGSAALAAAQRAWAEAHPRSAD